MRLNFWFVGPLYPTFGHPHVHSFFENKMADKRRSFVMVMLLNGLLDLDDKKPTRGKTGMDEGRGEMVISTKILVAELSFISFSLKCFVNAFLLL